VTANQVAVLEEGKGKPSPAKTPAGKK